MRSIVGIGERKWRRSSSSTWASLSAIRSYARRIRGLALESLIASSVVRELQREAVVPPAKQRHDRLEVVLVPAGDAHLVRLDRGLDLELGVLDRPDDGLGLLRRDALLDLD